jgi:hypothetical protein
MGPVELVAHFLPPNQVDDFFGDIGGMVADAFEIA